MFCQKCGKENKNGSKYCASCGEKLGENNVIQTNTDEPKVLSILSLVFSIILFPVGLILSIIGLVKCSKYKKENNKSSKYLVFNIAGLIISIFELFLITILVFVVIVLYNSFSNSDKIMKSTWECKMSPFSSNYVSTATFDGSNFTWSKYNDEENNTIKGTYNIINREYSDGDVEYELILKPNHYVISGKVQNNYAGRLEVDMKFTNSSATIEFDNLNYYCDRR